MNEQKEKWDKLALDDAKYYICARKDDSEEKFKQYGMDHYAEYIIEDPVVRNFIPDFSVSTILEIGCGIGRMTEFMASDFKKVMAVDVSKEMIRLGKERLASIANIDFIETDGESFPFENDSIDFAFSFLVFQHVPSMESIRKNFKEVNRVLKSAGMFKVQLRGVPTEKGKWFSGVDFDISSISDLCDQTVFEVIKYAGANTRSFWVWLKNE